LTSRTGAKKKPGRLNEPTGPRRRSLGRHTTSSPHVIPASQNDPDTFEATKHPLPPSHLYGLDAEWVQMVASGWALNTATFSGGDTLE